MSTTANLVGASPAAQPGALCAGNPGPPTTQAREALPLSSPATCCFEQLYASFYEAIFKHLYRLLGDREQAEDAAQDTFLKAWRALPRLREGSTLGPWLFRIATNTAYDLLRRRRILSWTTLDDAERGEQGYADPQEWDLVALPLVDLRQALQGLRPLDRAIIAYKGEGFFFPEIAQRLGISPAAAKTRFFRARARLREACALRPTASGGTSA